MGDVVTRQLGMLTAGESLLRLHLDNTGVRASAATSDDGVDALAGCMEGGFAPRSSPLPAYIPKSTTRNRIFSTVRTRNACTISASAMSGNDVAYAAICLRHALLSYSAPGTDIAAIGLRTPYGTSGTDL
eukprot:2495158-Rhodomonas_salina.5